MPEQQQLTSEQQEELKKKLASMSPEELREFQKKQCIFCHIISGKVAGKKVYEDDKVLAVLDINPANPGHILLMPKEHYMIMPQLPEEDLKYIFIIAKKLSNALLKSLEVRGTNIIVANGPAAGQKAQHFMIHIIPRMQGDGIEFEVPSKEYSDSELDEVADKIKKRLNELLGIQEAPKDASEVLARSKSKESKIKDAEIVDESMHEEEEDSETEEDNEDDSKKDKDSLEEELGLETSDDESEEDEDNDEDETSEDENSEDEEIEDSETESDEEEDSDEDSNSGGINLDDISRLING